MTYPSYTPTRNIVLNIITERKVLFVPYHFVAKHKRVIRIQNIFYDLILYTGKSFDLENKLHF